MWSPNKKNSNKSSKIGRRHWIKLIGVACHRISGQKIPFSSLELIEAIFLSFKVVILLDVDGYRVTNHKRLPIWKQKVILCLAMA